MNSLMLDAQCIGGELLLSVPTGMFAFTPRALAVATPPPVHADAESATRVDTQSVASVPARGVGARLRSERTADVDAAVLAPVLASVPVAASVYAEKVREVTFLSQGTGLRLNLSAVDVTIADADTSGVLRAKPKSQVLPGLYVGSIAAMRAGALHATGTTHAISLVSSTTRIPPDAIKSLTEHVRINLSDASDADLSKHLYSAVRFIDEARAKHGCVLVHCMAGISRSVAIVVAYLAWKLDWDVDTALEHVRRVRPRACPNSGFLAQLHAWRASLVHETCAPDVMSAEREAALRIAALGVEHDSDDDF